MKLVSRNERKTHCFVRHSPSVRAVSVRVVVVDSSWNMMAHGNTRKGKWRGNWWMEWVASTLHTTSEHGLSTITTADARTSAASSLLNWSPRRFKWIPSFRRKTKSDFCGCAITFQLSSTVRVETRHYAKLCMYLILKTQFYGVLSMAYVHRQYNVMLWQIQRPASAMKVSFPCLHWLLMYLWTDSVRQVFVKHQLAVDNNPVQIRTSKRNSWDVQLRNKILQG